MTEPNPEPNHASDSALAGTERAPGRSAPAGEPATLRVRVGGEPREVPVGATAATLFDDRAVIAVRINGVLRDLATVLADGDEVEPVRIDTPDGRSILRHSTAHVLAQAVQALFPGTRLGIGPPIENGFYYDFDTAQPFTPDDLRRIEQRMRDIIREGQIFRRRVVTDEQARTELAGEPYKLELISVKSAAADTEGAGAEIGGEELTIYDNLRPDGSLAWKDLCRGPHLPSTRHIPAFTLTRTAAAYWRGRETNPQLQRIYGTAWESRDALQKYLDLLREAERRDHRRLGVELDLFSFPDEIGSGLAVFHPKGGIIRREMENYSRLQHEKAGYLFVNTPHITKHDLFATSGHLQSFAEGMFPPFELDGGVTYYLKPMNCPMHILIYRSRGRSYRELPMRLFEFGTVYRYEKSGVVHGLTRARGFTQDDAHIFCTREQMGAELRDLLRFVLDLLRDYGLTDFYLELSTRDDSPKFVGDPADWAQATEALEAAARDSGLELVPDPGGAAYYGPKISVQARDAIGRSWQISTIQLDFNLPKRFDLEYQAADGTRQRPVMIHRALFGSIERFFGVLLEHYAGAFPPWLAPVQAVGIPVSDAHVPYLRDTVGASLRAAGIRYEVDDSDDRMQKKIRNAAKQKIPYLLIAGDDDIARHAVSFRYRDGSQKNGVPIADAVAEIRDAIDRRIQV
ncbi:threonyl-tRNA synthetase / Ser-tRNA(Thr) hydrolase [Acidothermus cellulolyticus 11B]|uniref:Threonine--tRNA ligase n=1 Tax=Acidothermus cellulolyticus (strain ATCC 43068 / DSM 8971 / 11B) TaxID=351607 RepID=A0LUM0_ACIC1|nr:threonine--tRNA ligase [Acidothermus cellulolyticus]ABK53130.1 threonyl-tRNA synthetase / Ser-tRNA(Thr) hydrolase [Acidothermus cellulolyticus 11B]